MATTWVFERSGERLRVQRQDVLGELRLVMSAHRLRDRVQVFDDEVQLVSCMNALDRQLVAAGWSLVDFFPERRRKLLRVDPEVPVATGAGQLARYTDRVHDAARRTNIALIRP